MAQVKSGHKILSGINYASYNLRLILDNNTSYFSAGTELILEKDGYTVDMKATQELANAKALIAQYHDSIPSSEIRR
mgnify:CR=1 FL=1